MMKLISHEKYREEIEWTNTWVSKANQKIQETSILLIGDSLSREFRSTLEKQTGWIVDYIGVSSLVSDVQTLKIIDTFFSIWNRKYDLIHIQLGDHGILTMENENISSFYYEYQTGYEQVIEYLMDKSKYIVLGTSTQVIVYPKYKNKVLNYLWVHFHSVDSEIIDKRYEEHILIRNDIVRNISNKYGLGLNDLYCSVKEKKFKHKDHVHYENKSKHFFSESVAGFLRDV